MMRWSHLVLLGLFTSLPAHAELVPYGSESVSFKPLPKASDLHPLNPAVRYVGGYEIDAHGTSQVMGLSDLQLTPSDTGLKVEAVSDLGAMIRFDLVPDGQGGMKTSPVKIDLLRDADGKTSINRDFNDAEGLAIAADGTHYVSYERFQRIMVFGPGVGWNGTPMALATGGIQKLPNNEGLEGIAILGDRLLAGAESGGFWLCERSGAGCTAIKGPSVPGFLYKLSGLAPVPGHGDEALALYRYFDGFHLKSIVSLLRLEGHSLVDAGELARIAPPLPADNYEGVAAVKTEGGYRLYLVSDSLEDDGKPKLLMFDWTH